MSVYRAPPPPRDIGEVVVLVIVAILALCLIYTGFSGCTPKPVLRQPTPVSAPAPASGCLPRKPPDQLDLDLTSTCGDHVCLTDDQAHALAAELRARRAWDAEAVSLCGVKP